jgi:cation:H+ antiporter
MLPYLLFVFGFPILIKGAEYLVKGSSSIAKRFNISDMAVGLTIVSFGTSMPELIVNIISSVEGSPGIAIGNIFGSNIANILLILGVTAIICPLPIKKSTILSEIPFSLIATLLIGFLANVSLFDSGNNLLVSRIDGFILLFFFALFLAYIYNTAKEKPQEIELTDFTKLPTGKSILFVVIGIFALFWGGKWIVGGAVKISNHLGISQSFIGLTIIAIGTSLPELVTSIIAARRKNIDIAVGNVIGSNIFNILWILGISSVIKPLPFDVIGNFDIFVMVFSSTIIILAIALGRQNNINRSSGIFFVICYLVYLIYLLKRG